MEENYLDCLNAQQRAAVEYCDGPQLVIAGAGSGKTRVLTYKIVHLLAHGFEPWRIMALTFTNKAAREMRERIQSLVGDKIASRIWMGTFHSIFARILRRHADRLGFKPDFTIYDATDSKSLIKLIIKDMELDDKAYKHNVVMNAISTAKNALIGPSAYAADRDIRECDRRSHRDRMAEVYATYVNRCHVAGAMDFDDLLYYTNVLMRDNPDVLHHYQEFFRYILVDEYQDTNFAQHLIVSQLCQDTGSLCVVGDDAQSIYSFRGANIRNILNLKNAYPGLKTFKLEQNYRSTQNIINAANSLIAKNKEQIPKQVFSKNSPGSKVEVVRCFSDYDEAYMVATRIASLQAQTSDTYDEFAVLYRTNAQSRILEEALRKRNIPYRIYGGLSFYQRKEVKDAISYFRLAINPDDDEALRRVINTPARGIGETTVRKLTRAAIDSRVSVWTVLCDPAAYGVDINKGTAAKLSGFAELIHGFIDMNAHGADALELARAIISGSRLLSVLISDTTPESISKQENLHELLNGVQEFVSDKIQEGNTDNIFMPDFLGEVSLATDQDEEETDALHKVTLMTIHAAKGLEFGNVFIVGVEEQLLPSAMSMDSPQAVEEERRLLYVAITRAKRFCMLSYATSRYRNGSTDIASPSRFLRDIDTDYLNTASVASLDSDRIDPVERFRSSFHSAPSRGIRGDSRYGFSTRPQTAGTGWGGAGSTAQAPMHPDIHTASDVAEGMRIEHDRFGKGTILSVDTSQPDARIRVKFDNVEVKTLLLKFARFKVLSR